MKKKKRKCNFLYDFVKITGAPVACVWLRPKVILVGDKATTNVKGGALIASNHSTFVDPIIVHCAFWRRRLNCIANEEIFNTKLKRWFFSNMNCILINKGNLSMRSLHQVRDTLCDGKAVVIFPEGTVNFKTDDIKTFKSGVILMAHMGNAPIIPTYVVKGIKWYNRTRVVVGEPINVKELFGEFPTMEEIDNACKLLHDKEEELKLFYENKYIR